MPLAAFPKCFIKEMVVAQTMSPQQWIDMAADQLDIDGLEFYWGFTPHHNSAAVEKLRKHAESRGLTIPMLCYSSDFTQPDPADRAREVETQKRAIETAALLGARYCRILSGQRRPEISRASGLRMVVDCIQQVLSYAEQQGITLILENHYKDAHWQYPEFAQKIDVFLELLSHLPQSKHFGVNYDPSNTIIAGEDPIAMLEAVKHRVVTMHASDRYFEGGTAEDLRKLEAHPQTGYSSILKHGVIGRGLNDYDRIFSILKSVGFNGWISIEDGEDPKVGMDHLRQSAEFLRQKMTMHGLT